MTPLTGRVAAACAAILGLLLIVEWLPRAEPVVAVPPAAHTTHSADQESETASKDTDAWAATILHRPLFTVGRKPPKGKGPVSIASSNGLPRLAGIMITAGGKRAIFMPEGGKPQTLAEGASVDEYTIRSILADHVVLTGGKGELTIRPTYDASGRSATTVSPPTFGQNEPNSTFQPPAFQPPAFRPPGFNPGFQPPIGFPPPGNANQNNDDSNDGQVVTPGQNGPPVFPGIRGPFVPRGKS